MKLQLDLTTFDASKFAPHVDRCASDGITFLTMADFADTARYRRQLFDLNKECSADIPGRGAFYTFDDYQRERIDVPAYDPGGVTIALAQNRWIGMAALADCRLQGYVFSEMTGVIRAYRRRGVALTMKVRGVDFARECGVNVIRTVHHPGNADIISMNKKLGYEPGSWSYP